MKVQLKKDAKTAKEGLLALYKNIDLEKVLKDYEEKLSDLRGCL